MCIIIRFTSNREVDRAILFAPLLVIGLSRGRDLAKKIRLSPRRERERESGRKRERERERKIEREKERGREKDLETNESSFYIDVNHTILWSGYGTKEHTEYTR